jgi:hypothetical protein
MWVDVGRYGEMWGDMPHAVDAAHLLSGAGWGLGAGVRVQGAR